LSRSRSGLMSNRASSGLVVLVTGASQGRTGTATVDEFGCWRSVFDLRGEQLVASWLARATQSRDHRHQQMRFRRVRLSDEGRVADCMAD
jgi:hypothetical protein